MPGGGGSGPDPVWLQQNEEAEAVYAQGERSHRVAWALCRAFTVSWEARGMT